MSDFARRFLAAHATVMNAGRAEQYPDVFDGTAALVNEISDAVCEARWQIDQLKTERLLRDLAAMASTTVKLETLLQQSLAMTQSLRTVLEFHKGRAAS